MVSIISASQSLRKLNPNVVEQSNSLILFRGSKADIDTLSVPASLKKDLLALKVGHAIVYCPGNLPTKMRAKFEYILRDFCMLTH